MTVFKLGTTVKNFISGINANFTELASKLTYKPISYKVLYSGSNYGVALVDVQLVSTNVVITSDEAFEGYVVLV